MTNEKKEYTIVFNYYESVGSMHNKRHCKHIKTSDDVLFQDNLCLDEAHTVSQVIDKLTSVLPERLQKEISKIFQLSMTSKAEVAIRTKNKLHFTYENVEGDITSRCVRPLCLKFFSPFWLLLTWCEKRNDFRHFRVDRIEKLTVLEERFKDEKGKRLHDYCQHEAYLEKDYCYADFYSSRSVGV